MKKNQALFSSKDKSKKLKCHLLQFLFGAFRVNSFSEVFTTTGSHIFSMHIIFILLIMIT